MFNKTKKDKSAAPVVENSNKMAANGQTRNGESDTPKQQERPKLVFHCQQAHGSPTGVISGFTNVKELYQRIAECYGIQPSDILFCTLNTHKVDMQKLLGGQIGLDDFIFAHIRGQPKVVDIEKSEDALGLTITDNGAGFAFIKRIKEGSIIDRIAGIKVGDHIEKINDVSMVGCRHFEVAKTLKEVEKGSMFSLRIVEPLQSGFSEIGGRSGGGNNKKGIGSGKKTLRLRSTGPATVEAEDEVMDAAIEKINQLLEDLMGINDTELAQSIFEKGANIDNPSEFATAMDNSDLEVFGFSDMFIFELYGAIDDAKKGRLKKGGGAQAQEFSEQF